MEDTAIDLRGLLGLLRRQLRLIVVTTLVGVILAGIVAFWLTPVFTATALVLVDPSRKNLLEPDAQLSGGMSDNARLDSEVEIAKSDNVLLRVVKSLDLISKEQTASPGLREQLLTMLRLSEPQQLTTDELISRALNDLRNDVSVQRRGLTYLIAVQARSASPAEAATLANGVVEAYIADQVQSKIDSVLTASDALNARTEQARTSIVKSEGSFDRFVSDNIASIVADTGRSDLGNTQSQIDALISERSRVTTLASTVESDLADGNIDAIVASLQSDALTELNRRRAALDAQLAGGSAAQAASIRADLAALDQQMRSTATTEVSNLRNSITKSQSQETDLRKSLRTAVLGSPLSADTLTQLYQLQQDANIARTQYENLLARTRDLQTQASLQVADSRVVSPAMTPQLPSFPNRPLIILIAGLVSLGAGIGLALLYENLIGGFTSEAQMQSVLKRPVAAVLPMQKTKDGKSPANLVATAPLSVFAEGVRRIRAAVEQSVRARGTHTGGIVVMFSSSASADGKTTMALSLARSFALSGRSTLLIDCDLRKPSIHQLLDQQPSEGLLEYLRTEDVNARSLSNIINQDSLTGATVIVGSRRSHVATDQFLDGPQFSALIKAARKSFDIIVLDTPPIEPVVDGLYVAPLADVIVIVARWAQTPQTAVKKAIAQLTAAKTADADVLVVLNQQHESLNAQRRKYSDYYSEPV